MNCTPQSLAAAAKCLRGLSGAEFEMVRLYLLCAWASNPAGGSFLVDPQGNFVIDPSGNKIVIP